MGASFFFFLLELGSLRPQQNFPKAHPTFHDQFKWPLEDPFLSVAAGDLCSDLPILSWKEITSITITNLTSLSMVICTRWVLRK